MTAAEKAMQDIGDALDAYFEGRQSEPSTLNAIARANGAYLMEQTGVGA